jgi:hypothetical protein
VVEEKLMNERAGRAEIKTRDGQGVVGIWGEGRGEDGVGDYA